MYIHLYKLSLMSFKFSPFVFYLILLGTFWYISLPAGLLCMVVAFRKKTTRRYRIIAGLAALFFLLPVLWYASDQLKTYQDEHRYRAERTAHRWKTDRVVVLDSVSIPAGSTIYFDTFFDMNKKANASLNDITDIELAAPTRIFNTLVKDTIRHVTDGYWILQLAKAQPVSGWPCSGQVEMYSDGLRRGTLSADYSVHQLQLPRGTGIEIDPFTWTFHFPDGRIISADPANGKILFNSDSLSSSP